MSSVLVGMERVTRLMVRCGIYEKMYLGDVQQLSIAENLVEALASLYHSILKFLIFAKQYFEKNGHGRLPLTSRYSFITDTAQRECLPGYSVTEGWKLLML